MVGGVDLREQFAAALDGRARGRAVAQRLCGACVNLLDVDGAALSIMYDGVLSQSFAASNTLSGELDELQFTLGEGPCMDAVSSSAPAMMPDLNSAAASRWPAFTREALERGVHAVFALPVYVTALPIGALDLYRQTPGRLATVDLDGALLAAELAALPLLDLMGLDLEGGISDQSSDAWKELSALTRIEVYQAAGMVISQLEVGPAEALIRIRGYAYAHNMTTSEVAYEILERRLRLPDDQGHTDPGNGSR